MKLRIFLYLFLLLPFICKGKNISRKDVLNDLHYLNDAVKNGHPVNYMLRGFYNIDAVIRQVEQIQNDSITVNEYRFILGSALQEIGCVHTSVVNNPLLPGAAQKNWFPVNIVLLQGKLFVSRQSDSSLKIYEGREIAAINSQPATQIANKLLKYSASDGGGYAFAQAHVNFLMSPLLAMYFDYPSFYEIRFLNGDTLNLPASAKAVPLANSLNRTNSYHRAGELGILKVGSFKKSDAAFFRSTFKEILSSGITNLVIDFRGNTGGHLSASVALTRYLVDTVFEFSFLRPELSTRKYLNGKGKFLYFLSKIKYNLTEIFRRERTMLGKEYHHRFTPEKNSFKGRIYVITDGFTASAPTMVTSWLKQHTHAIFVGSRAGGGYNGNNSGSYPLITLPASQIQIKFPAYRMILDPTSADSRGIDPDFPVTYDISDIINGRDKKWI